MEWLYTLDASHPNVDGTPWVSVHHPGGKIYIQIYKYNRTNKFWRIRAWVSTKFGKFFILCLLLCMFSIYVYVFHIIYSTVKPFNNELSRDRQKFSISVFIIGRFNCIKYFYRIWIGYENMIKLNGYTVLIQNPHHTPVTLIKIMECFIIRFKNMQI